MKAKIIIVFVIEIKTMWPSQGMLAERIRRQPCYREITGLIDVHGHFSTPFSKEFNLAMLKRASIAPQRWPAELPGTTIANQHT